MKRLAATAATAVVATAVANTLIGIIAVAAGVPQTIQLTPPVDIFFSVIASAVAAVGWFIVVRKVANPEPLLRRLVPIVLVVSFIPDVLLGISTASATGLGPALVLAFMHIASAVIIVGIFRRLMPPSTAATL